MKKTLYLMRHGQTLFNLQHKIQGWCDAPLTPLGIKQAQNIGAEVIKDEVTNIQADYLNEKGHIFKVGTLNNEFEAKSVILATGNKKIKRFKRMEFWCF